MDRAWIDGRAVPLKAAITEAARLLGASRVPLIAGLGTDIAGARAAIALARRIGAAIDHMHSSALLRDLDVMRDAGVMITTPGEARARADCLLLVGAGAAAAFTEWPPLFNTPTAPEAGAAPRRICWLCPGRDAARAGAPAGVTVFGRDPADVPVLLAALRARVAGRPIGKTSLPMETIDALATYLAAARFGVAVWSVADLDPLATEMLYGVVADLNAKTRFTSLSLGPNDNALGVTQVCGWTTGFPVRIGFGGTYPEHDPWRFDAGRLVESGEVDCALWISAYGDVAPDWRKSVPIIALTAAQVRFREQPRIAIEVGRPGVDHDGLAYVSSAGALALVAATKSSPAPSVARILGELTIALPQAGA
jgi:formylmethanofuran dehydrogenase subunit B